MDGDAAIDHHDVREELDQPGLRVDRDFAEVRGERGRRDIGDVRFRGLDLELVAGIKRPEGNGAIRQFLFSFSRDHMPGVAKEIFDFFRQDLRGDGENLSPDGFRRLFHSAAGDIGGGGRVGADVKGCKIGVGGIDDNPIDRNGESFGRDL